MRGSVHCARRLVGVLAVVALAGCAHKSRVADRISESAPAWESLFNGQNLNGWKAQDPKHSTWQVVGGVKVDEADDKRFVVTPGAGVLLNTPGGTTSNLISERSFIDCEMHVEWTIPKDSNSGIYFESRYEVQILDSFGKKEIGVHDAGAIYSQWIDEKNVNGHTPRVNVALAPGEWQTFDVIFHAPRFDADGKKTRNARFERVFMNGTLIHENVDVFGPTRAGLEGPEAPQAPFLLQGDHGPVAFRNFRIRPIH